MRGCLAKSFFIVSPPGRNDWFLGRTLPQARLDTLDRPRPLSLPCRTHCRLRTPMSHRRAVGHCCRALVAIKQAPKAAPPCRSSSSCLPRSRAPNSNSCSPAAGHAHMALAPSLRLPSRPSPGGQASRHRVSRVGRYACSPTARARYACSPCRRACILLYIVACAIRIEREERGEQEIMERDKK